MTEQAAPVRRRAARLARLLAVALVAVLVAGTAPGAGAAPGQPDPSYGANGSVEVGLNRLSLLPVGGGRVVVFGTEPDGTVVARRVTAAGAVDLGFGVGGRAVLGPGDPNHVAPAFSQFSVFGDLDPTGRIVAVDAIDGIVRRLSVDGMPDPTWPAAGVPVAGMFDLAVDAAGRPVLATSVGLVRLTSAGSLDLAFGPGGTVVFPSGRFPIRVDVDTADRPVVGIQIGSTCGPRFVCSGEVVRLASTGAADSTFRPAAVPNIYDVTIAPDGSVLLGTEGPLLRLASDGTRLATAATTGAAPITAGADGTVFAVDNRNGGAVALRPDLTVESRFGHCGYALGRTEPYIGDITITGVHLVASHVTTIEAFQLQPGGPDVPYVPGHAVIAVDHDGSVAARGPACVTHGLGVTPNQPVVGAVTTPTYKGLWMVAADGGVFGFGDAGFFGSTGSIRLNRPVVGMAATPSGRGYWLVASDGGIFAFGDAGFFGSTGSIRLNRPVVGMAATPSGRGYWLVASDGGIFAFGDASFFGSAGGLPLVAPVTGMAATTRGDGYWMVARDGGVFSYGGAGFIGRVEGTHDDGQPPAPVVAIVADPDGSGYATLQQAQAGAWAEVHTFGVDDQRIAGPLPGALQAVGLVIA